MRSKFFLEEGLFCSLSDLSLLSSHLFSLSAYTYPESQPTPCFPALAVLPLREACPPLSEKPSWLPGPPTPSLFCAPPHFLPLPPQPWSWATCAFMCAKSLQSCLTLCNTMDCNLPDSYVHEILQARILEWVAMPSSRGFSWPRDQTPTLAGRFFTTSAPGKAHELYP